MEALWAQLLSTSSAPVDDLTTWRKAQLELHNRNVQPFDRALLGGHGSHKCAFAFASGYQAALASLFGLEPGELGALCVTEASGGHPKHIATELLQHEQGLRLSGRKVYVTMGELARTLFVLASRGPRPDGTKDLVVVRLPIERAGVQIEALPPTPFTPELPHAAVELSDVETSMSEILPKDGYLGYTKPFRTVEDIHIQGAVIGFLARAALERGWSTELFEQILAQAMTLRALSTEDPSAVSTHLALAGALQQSRSIVQASLQTIESQNDEWANAWRRDHALLQIAEKARQKRASRAWEQLR